MRRARLVGASVAAVLLAGSLSGCLADGYTNHPSDGGRASGDVAAAVEALPGVANVDAYTVPWYSPGEGDKGRYLNEIVRDGYEYEELA